MGEAWEVEIGEPENFQLRHLLEADMPAWLSYYCEDFFRRPFSARAHVWLADAAFALRNKSRCASAPWRGEGATVLSAGVALYGVLTGLSRHVALVTARPASFGGAALGAFQAMLSGGRLQADYPEVGAFVRAIGGGDFPSQARRLRQRGQRKEAGFRWMLDRVVFPRVEGVTWARCSGATVYGFGFGTFPRGLAHIDAAGEPIRRDALIFDSPFSWMPPPMPSPRSPAPQTDAQAREAAYACMRMRAVDHFDDWQLVADAGGAARVAFFGDGGEDAAGAAAEIMGRPEWQGPAARAAEAEAKAEAKKQGEGQRA